MPQHPGKQKGNPRKKAETLGLIGTILGSAGTLLGDPQTGQALATPFLTVADNMQRKQRERQVLEVLRGTLGLGGVADQAESMGIGVDEDDQAGLQPGVPQGASGGQVPQEAVGDIASQFGVPSGGGQPSARDAQLMQLAQADPALAERILIQKMLQKPEDPMNTILKKLGIQEKLLNIGSFETPGQKRASAIKQTEEEIRTKRRVTAETFSDKQQEDLQKSKDAVFLQDQIIANLQDGTTINKLQALGSRGAFSFGVMQDLGLVNEKQIELIKALNSNVMQTLKLTSGVQFSDREREFMTATLPNTFDSPEALFQGMNNIQLRTKLGQVSRIYTQMIKSKSTRPAEIMNMSNEQITALRHMKNQLRDDNLKNLGISAAEYFKNPPSAEDVAALRLLGLNQFID